jgi:FkbM family methyltransferase
VVVDVGSNIGLSALYFLTRPSRPYCFLYEPDPRNTARLRDNVARFADRWELAEAAVAARPGRVRFATEPTGRYGRVGGDPAPRRSRSTAWGSTTCSSGRSRAPGPSTS